MTALVPPPTDLELRLLARLRAIDYGDLTVTVKAHIIASVKRSDTLKPEEV